MNEIPPDQYRDALRMDRLRKIAEHIFQRRGIDFASARRAGGWSNATWIAGGLALRLSVQPGSEAIRREARLASLLPTEVGYPPILESGVTNGYEWSLSQEIPGENLGEVWPRLDWDQRISALRQLWARVEAVHCTDVSAAAGWARQGSPFYPTDPRAANAGLDRLQRQEFLSARQRDILEAALERFWRALPEASPVLNHGDFTIENALWREGQVVALLDFEYALIAPDELDANELVKMAFAPSEASDLLPDPGGAGLERLRRTAIELSLPMLTHPGSRDLLLGYAILLETWMLENRLSHTRDIRAAAQQPLYQVLAALADGRGGYLAPLLAVMDG